MGRMKDVYLSIIQENYGSLPDELTIQEIAHMKELEMYNYKEYKRKYDISKKDKKAIDKNIENETNN